MKTLQFAVLAALLALAATRSILPWPRLCPIQGQFFSSCAPPAPDCVPTCENPNAACRALCRPGCKCPYGQVLDTKNRRCVRRDLCPQVVCSLEPEVGFCRGYFPRYFHNSTSKQCEKFIYGGCGGNGNKFTNLSKCQKDCNVCPVEGQVFSTCARPCTFTCDNVEELACITVCVTGCDCPGGQVIDTELNKCVPVKECPTKKCPVKGQQFFDGVNECIPCVGTCKNPRPICPLVCQSGCACPLGTVLDTEANACVNPKQCPVGRSCRHSDGTEIKDGGSYKPNPCTTCQCDNGKLLCAVQDCAAPPCDDYIVPPGECCPVCPVSCELSNGTSVPHGTNYQPDPCTFCQCDNGKVFCAVQDCAAPPCDDYTVLPGQCCPVCPGRTLPPKCAAVLCLAVDCPGAMIPEGECCPVCPGPTLPPKCAAVLCLAVDCPGAMIPEGECCPVCPNVCKYNGQTYNPGDSFPSTDGCNTCSCSEAGLVACTERACLPKLVCPKPTGFGICVESCPVGVLCGPGMKCCYNGCGHVCTKAIDCALVDCAPPSCDFIGGVAVPAGEDECCPTCGCRSGGNTYRVGESFPAGDGCNTCSCTPRGVRCTLIACKSPALKP